MEIPGSEITDETTYLNRRNFMRAGVVAATTLATGWVYRELNPARSRRRGVEKELATIATSRPSVMSDSVLAKAYRTDEPQTPLQDITHYNNYYEFTTTKEEVADVATSFVTRPWTVEVKGLCAKP